VSTAADPIDSILSSSPLDRNSLTAMAQAVRNAPPSAGTEEGSDKRTDFAHSVTPPVPESLEETGVAGSLIEQLILK
jgi:hypothetical protein